MFFKWFLAASSKRTCKQLSIIPSEGEGQSADDAEDSQAWNRLHLLLINVCISVARRCS